MFFGSLVYFCCSPKDTRVRVMWNVTIIMFSFFVLLNQLLECVSVCVLGIFLYCTEWRLLVEVHTPKILNPCQQPGQRWPQLIQKQQRQPQQRKPQQKNDQNIDNHNKTIIMKTTKIMTIFIIFLISCNFWYWRNYPTVLEVEGCPLYGHNPFTQKLEQLRDFRPIQGVLWN